MSPSPQRVALQQPPAEADQVSRARATTAMVWIQCLLFAAGGVIGLAILPFADFLDADQKVAVSAVSGCALAIAAALALTWRRLPPVGFQFTLALATLMITATVPISSARPAVAGLFYVWVGLYAAYFFTTPQAMAQIGFAAVAYAIALTQADDAGVAVVSWIVTVSTLAITALLFGYLKQLLARRLEEGEKTRQELEASLSLHKATLESTADGLLVVDRDGHIVSFNQLFQTMWRIPDEVLESSDDEQAIGFVLDQLANPDQFVRKVQQLYERPQAESYDMLDFKDGRVFERYSQPQLGNEGEIFGRVWSFRDVTAQVQIETQLRHMADHDVLTGLLNRRRFEEEVGKRLAHTARYGGDGAVLLLDLDNFKYVNDSLGHHTGDAVIRSIAALLRERLRETDVLARVGGDELAILLPEADAKAAAQVAGELLELIRNHRPLVRGQRTRLTTSAGIAMIGGASERTTEEIIVEADIAMYRAKEAGRDRFHIYETPATGQPAEQQGIPPWSDRIREALEQDRFVLYAQPIVDLRTDRPSQWELLVRMIDEQGKLLNPAAFLPSAERTGIVTEIDMWVISEGIRLIAAEEQAGRRLTLEINLSGYTLSDPHLVGSIESALKHTPIDPGSLIFEVTETAAVVNLDDARDFAQALTKLGCRFALDDFGAGFGSFFYLKYLPLDFLKIDGDFIVDLVTNKIDQAVVQAIVELSRRLGMKTIAEFVGDQETVDLLRRYGVDFGQGFYLGEPTPIEELWGSTRRIGQPLSAAS